MKKELSLVFLLGVIVGELIMIIFLGAIAP